MKHMTKLSQRQVENTSQKSSSRNASSPISQIAKGGNASSSPLALVGLTLQRIADRIL